MTGSFAPAMARTVSKRRQLEKQLKALCDGHGTVLVHREKAWASITFQGARHELLLRFDGEEAVAAGTRMIAALPDHEFTISGQLVADATVTFAEEHTPPEPLLAVTIELLLLEDN